MGTEGSTLGGDSSDQSAAASADEPDEEPSAGQLLPGERLLFRVARALLTFAGDGSAAAAPRSGRLYLTNRRLIHVDGEPISVELSELVEQAIAGDRLLLVLEGGRGLVVELDGAHDFRTRLAAAVVARRAEAPAR